MPEEVKQKPGGLSDDEIMFLDTHAREAQCAAEVNEVLKKFNCAYNPVAHISNSGSYVEVRVVALAYTAKDIVKTKAGGDPDPGLN
jgi:hypothetical protein